MDDIDQLLNTIITKVTESKLSDEEKADVFAEISVGFRKLVWPILLAHVPGYVMEYTSKKSSLTVEDYTSLITSSLSNPATGKELHDELKSALEDVNTLLTKRFG